MFAQLSDFLGEEMQWENSKYISELLSMSVQKNVRCSINAQGLHWNCLTLKSHVGWICRLLNGNYPDQKSLSVKDARKTITKELKTEDPSPKHPAFRSPSSDSIHIFCKIWFRNTTESDRIPQRGCHRRLCHSFQYHSGHLRYAQDQSFLPARPASALLYYWWRNHFIRKSAGYQFWWGGNPVQSQLLISASTVARDSSYTCARLFYCFIYSLSMPGFSLTLYLLFICARLFL